MVCDRCLFLCIHVSISVGRVMAEKLIGLQLTKKFLHCMESELSLPYVILKNKIQILRS